MKDNNYACIVTGEVKYIPPSLSKSKIAKFGSVEEFRKHYISPTAAKLLRGGQTVNEIREGLGIEDMPTVDPHVLARLNLMRKKRGKRALEDAEKLERVRYLNSKEFRDKMRAIKERQKNLTFEEWVQKYTGTGRERGGTCLRPDNQR